MQLSKNEIALAWFALRVDEHPNMDGSLKARTYPIDEQGDAIAVAKKLKPFIKVEGDKQVIEGGDVELSTEEKAFLLKITPRPWGLEDAETFVELKAKLS